MACYSSSPIKLLFPDAVGGFPNLVYDLPGKIVSNSRGSRKRMHIEISSLIMVSIETKITSHEKG